MTASSKLNASRLPLPAERHFEQYLAATLASQVVCLPANYESLCARVVTTLHAHLASGDGASARQTIRPLIEKIVVQPSSARGVCRRAIR